MDALFENASRIFEVARSGRGVADAESSQDFALLIKPDGGLHFVMESPFSIEAAALDAGAATAYRVTRSQNGIRVEGRGASANCVLEERSPGPQSPWLTLLRDQPLYRMTSPLLISATSGAC